MSQGFISIAFLCFPCLSFQEHLIETLCKYVDSCDPTRKVFAVDMTGTSFTREINKKVKLEEYMSIFIWVNLKNVTLYTYIHTYSVSGLEKSLVLLVLDQIWKLKTDLFLDRKLKNRSIKLGVLKILQYTD